MLRVDVTIKQIENKHLQNWLIFLVWIIWGTQKKCGEALPPNVPRCYGPAWHHLHILVKAPLCCDWKGRAAVAQCFPLLHQATMKIPRRDHFISACSRHMGVVHHAHPVRGESHIHHNANWEAATLAPRLGQTFWNDWEWKSQLKCNPNKLRYK